MPKIKEVPSTEVHWQVANWNVRDVANARIKQTMGADAQYFAPVYVTHGSYYWSEPDADGWVPLTVVSDDDRAEARALLAQLQQKAVSRMPARAQVIKQVFTFPNDDFIFVRRRTDGSLDLRLTGWGFANYNRAHATVISETIESDKINEISVSFSVDGQPVPNREFSFARGMEWAPATTDDTGYYNFGRHMPGAQISVRDNKTGIERITVVEAETTNIDVDVTQYLTVRVIGRHDGQPISGETAHLEYGRRSGDLTLEQGSAGCSLPWFEGVECTVKFRGTEQRRELRNDILNEFVFESQTPRIPKTNVIVRLTDNGAPITGEEVQLSVPGGTVKLYTDQNGVATFECDYVPGAKITATVRKHSETADAIDGTVEFDMTFDTPVPVEFDCRLKVVDNADAPMAFYPVNINIGDGSGLVECLTDENGCVGPIHVLSGNTMTVCDGNKPSYREDFLLEADRTEYVFHLPYDNVPNLGDVSLRVVQRNGAPAAGTTCIVSQDSKRLTAMLDGNGMMFFGSDSFDYTRPAKVELYSPVRTYPVLELPLEPNEKQYELIEVDGPQPWWKIVGEIALAAAAILSLAGLYFLLDKVFYGCPNLFA